MDHFERDSLSAERAYTPSAEKTHQLIASQCGVPLPRSSRPTNERRDYEEDVKDTDKDGKCAKVSGYGRRNHEGAKTDEEHTNSQ